MQKKSKIPQLFTANPKPVNTHEIFPFTQRPSENQFQSKPTNKEDAPSDLFSRFTADIIRQEVIFTR